MTIDDLCSVVSKQSTEGLAVMRTTNSLGQHLGDIKDIKFGAQSSLVLILWHTVGGDELVDAAVLDTRDGVAAKDTVSDKSEYLCSAFPLQELGSACDLSGCVSHVNHAMIRITW